MKLNSSERGLWLKIINKLKHELPASMPVLIRTRQLKSLDGYVAKDSKFWYVIISSELNFEERVASLVHEYAHALDNNPHHGEDWDKIHRASWGVQYAKCYRVVYGDCDLNYVD